jgi:outer membrane protein TolC
MKVSADRGERAALSAYNTQVVRVESGVGIFVDQLDALAALTRARANSARAEFDLQLAVAKLYRTAGLVGPTATSEVPK